MSLEKYQRLFEACTASPLHSEMDEIIRIVHEDFPLPLSVQAISAENNRFHFAREIIYTLKTCNAINEKVYLHWIDKLINDEKDAAFQSPTPSSASELVENILYYPLHEAISLFKNQLEIDKKDSFEDYAKAKGWVVTNLDDLINFYRFNRNHSASQSVKPD